MRRPAALAALLAVTAAVSACGGSSTPSATATTAAPVLPSAPGGLVGIIDRARLLTVCADIREASTALDGGMPRSEVDRILLAAARELERPPRVRAAVDIAAGLRTAVRSGAEASAVQAGTSFCASHGG